MKRTLSLMAALLLTLSFALAETSAYDALAVQYDALLQREEAIGLEMQIIDLQLQLARLNGDGTALAAHQAQQDALWPSALPSPGRRPSSPPSCFLPFPPCSSSSGRKRQGCAISSRALKLH